MMYLKQILSGDFGKSYSYNQPVIELIMERVPNTLLITLTSLLIALVLGVMAGIISAIKQYSMLDYIYGNCIDWCFYAYFLDGINASPSV